MTHLLTLVPSTVQPPFTRVFTRYALRSNLTAHDLERELSTVTVLISHGQARWALTGVTQQLTRVVTLGIHAQSRLVAHLTTTVWCEEHVGRGIHVLATVAMVRVGYGV